MKVVSRTAWGAESNSFPTNISPEKGGIAFHYVGGEGKLTPSSHSKCASIVREIERHHIHTNGWVGIAYSALVCQHGYVYQGRWTSHRTAANGTNDANNRYYAICGLVNKNDIPTAEMIQALKESSAYFRAQGGAGREAVGHRDVYNTDCPGGQLYQEVKKGTFRGKIVNPNKYPGSPIHYGDRGGSVKKVQKQLIKRGHPVGTYGADGIFGDDTKAAVLDFQEAHKLRKDGIVGPKTWVSLFGGS